MQDLEQRLFRPFQTAKVPHIRDAKVLVTGAGGSIGTELCRQIIRSGAGELIAFDVYDGNLWHMTKALEPCIKRSRCKVTLVLGDVKDERGTQETFRMHTPDYVFHAAAVKHVPMLEDELNMMQAVKTNVLGTLNVLHASLMVGRCVLVNVSTDKAVYPASILGLTKRCAELGVWLNSARFRVPMASVRFANVLDSVGSVTQLFRSQARAGLPLTITDKDMTRYFMTGWQAAGLVIAASDLVSDQSRDDAWKTSGFMLDMGVPVNIVDLAKLVYWQETGKKNPKIRMVGVRPGEKMMETLRYDFENEIKTKLLSVVRLDHTGESENSYVDRTLFDELISVTRDHYPIKAMRLMRMLVPQYSGSF